MSPRLQEAIASPEGLMIAGMTALTLVVSWLVLRWLLQAHDRREAERIRQEIEAGQRRLSPEDAARRTP
jgi:hypothetical protein